MDDNIEQDKIQSEDSPEDIIMKMSDGNPGAVRVLTSILNEKGMMRFMKFAMQLDLMRMYGSDIWLGYKDFCDQDVDHYYELVIDEDEELRQYVENYPDNVT